jgi:hypothetical protein
MRSLGFQSFETFSLEKISRSCRTLDSILDAGLVLCRSAASTARYPLLSIGRGFTWPGRMLRYVQPLGQKTPFTGGGRARLHSRRNLSSMLDPTAARRMISAPDTSHFALVVLVQSTLS